MIYFDSNMSKSTNTIVYFDWKRVIYIYVCENVAHNLCCQIRADDNLSTCTFTTGNASQMHRRNTQSINRSFFTKRKKDVMLELYFDIIGRVNWNPRLLVLLRYFHNLYWQ